MNQEVGPLLPDINTNVISPQFLSNPLNIESCEEVESVPRVGDLWLLVAAISLSHQVRFFFPRVMHCLLLEIKWLELNILKLNPKS
jgi:hypothetical protein